MYFLRATFTSLYFTSTTKIVTDRTNFTMPMLHNYELKLDCKDYSKNKQEFYTYLAFLYFVEVLEL